MYVAIVSIVRTLHDNVVLSVLVMTINIRRKNIVPAPSSQCEEAPQLTLTHKIDTLPQQLADKHNASKNERVRPLRFRRSRHCDCDCGPLEAVTNARRSIAKLITSHRTSSTG